MFFNGQPPTCGGCLWAKMASPSLMMHVGLVLCCLCTPDRKSRRRGHSVVAKLAHQRDDTQILVGGRSVARQKMHLPVMIFLKLLPLQPHMHRRVFPLCPLALQHPIPS